MSILKTVTLLSLSVTLALSAAQGKKENEFKEVTQIGKKSSMKLVKALGSNMKQHMKKGGPMDALTFCSTEAYSLTESVNKKLPKGITVKRTSSKVRSEANKPQDDEMQVIKLFESMKNSHVVLPPHLIQKISKNHYKYYKPLTINKPICLKCHGNLEKNDTLAKAINEKYPTDKATGYKMGDVRGVIVVDIEQKF